MSRLLSYIRKIKIFAFIGLMAFVGSETLFAEAMRAEAKQDPDKIAKQYFNGGGHMNAAGGISEASVNKTITKVEQIINEYKNELNNQN